MITEAAIYAKAYEAAYASTATPAEVRIHPETILRLVRECGRPAVDVVPDITVPREEVRL